MLRGVAQMGARVVWDHEVAGSIPVASTRKIKICTHNIFLIIGTNFYLYNILWIFTFFQKFYSTRYCYIVYITIFIIIFIIKFLKAISPKPNTLENFNEPAYDT